jgi:hypothetical protein
MARATAPSDGLGSAAAFSASPAGVAVDAGVTGRAYVADALRVRQVSPVGGVSTLAGSGAAGAANGAAATATFTSLTAIAVSAGGVEVYVTDQHAVRVVAGGVVSTLAGTVGAPGGWKDGVGSSAVFNWPRGLALLQEAQLRLLGRVLEPEGVFCGVVEATEGRLLALCCLELGATALQGPGLFLKRVGMVRYM